MVKGVAAATPLDELQLGYATDFSRAVFAEASADLAVSVRDVKAAGS